MDEEATTEVSHGIAPKLSEAKALQLKKAEEAARRAKLEALLDENETEEDRKLRERRLVEEGDNELTNELFSGAGDEPKVPEVDPNAVVIDLKDLKDHLNLCDVLKEKMAKSKRNHIVAFTKAFIKFHEEAYDVPDLQDMIIILNKFKTEKEAKAKKPTLAKKEEGKGKKKSKKEIMMEKKKHDDLFGDNERHGEYDHYEDQFDDFF